MAESGITTYGQKRLSIRRSIERLCEQQITRILNIGRGDSVEYSAEELRARHRRKRLGPALANSECAELGLVRS